MDEFLTWDAHINLVLSKLGSSNFAIARTKNFLPLKIRTTLYNSMFKSHLEFGILAFGCAKSSKLKKNEILQKKCIRHVSNVGGRAHSEPLFHKLQFLKFEDIFNYNVCTFLHQYSNKLLPASFNEMFPLMRESENRNSRDGFYNFEIIPPKQKNLNNFPRHVFLPIWNGLSSMYQSTVSHKHFKSELLKALLQKYETFVTYDNLLCDECKDSDY